MKKHLFAASVTTALAVTSASVAAESSVTLYGVIDTGLGYAKVSGDYRDPKTGAVNRLDNSHVGMTNGTTAGSRWGLRGKRPGRRAVCNIQVGIGLQLGQWHAGTEQPAVWPRRRGRPDQR